MISLLAGVVLGGAFVAVLSWRIPIATIICEAGYNNPTLSERYQIRITESACTPFGEPKRFRGVWSSSFENSSLMTENRYQPAWLEMDDQAYRDLEQALKRKVDSNEQIELEFIGRESATGGFGHLGSFNRLIVVEKIIFAQDVSNEARER